jgi:DNA polymerase III subunit gamma/tau
MVADSAPPVKRRFAGQVSISAMPTERPSAAAVAELESDREGEMPTSTREVNPVLLLKVWRDYATVQKNKGRNSLHATLVAKEPQVVGPGRISFAIVNEVQEKDLRSEKPELLGHIRRELGDPALELEVVKTEVQVRKRHTPLDKFKLMAEKNPALLTLREALDLDIG